MTRRIRFFIYHLGLSFFAITLIGVGAILLWFPMPYRTAAGGLAMLALLCGVDLTLGPLTTLFLAKPLKSLKELRLDISIVAIVQISAMAYGVHSIYVARPVHTVFEVDRLTGISANNVLVEDLPAALPELRHLPRTGPTLIASRISEKETPEEKLRSLSLALNGIDISSQPKRWVRYESMLPEVLKASRPVAQLIGAYPALQPQLAALAASEKLPLDQLRFLPMVIHKAQWTAVLSPDASRILDYYHVDGFIDEKNAAPVQPGKP